LVVKIRNLYFQSTDLGLIEMHLLTLAVEQ